MSETMSIKEVMVLIKLKKENPKEYKEFLQGFKEIMMDTFKIIKELGEEIEND